ncbi:MAG TPA: L,D-transpeptidase family protein [Pyrinomonadaceae bacterium]|nr:L,D-transpeptidase family protein [Pyrinomonadaceae bacterium]
MSKNSRNINRMLVMAAICITGIITAASTANANRGSENEQIAARVTEAEQLLSSLGYWVLNVDGRTDASTRHAIVAFQKAEGLKRTGILNEDLLAKLRAASRPVAKYAGEAHVEIDLPRQILMVVDDDGQVSRILPISTGSGQWYVSEGKRQKAFTPTGEFKITRQIKGNRKAPLGTIYYPSYFHEGWAIHGSNSIPVTPASHGCARVPRFAEKELSNMLHVGMPVFVY